MLYTRKGDDGTSGLFNTKDRFPKDSPIFEALGTIDELNSFLGICYSSSKKATQLEIDIPGVLREVQEHLFITQAELAGADKSILQKHVDRLESLIAQIEERIQNPHAFIISGATELSSLFDYARSLSRRAERSTISARDQKALSLETYKYLNRLSSLLYALGRYAAQSANEKEPSPSYS